MAYYVGIDWAAAVHAVCVMDDAGRVRWHGTVGHSAAGLAELVRRLKQFAPPAELRIALERPSGLLVDTLVEAGFVVVPIHPNAVKATRPRYSTAGAKSDPGDAFMLADILRTDGHRWRPLRGVSDGTRALRALVRGRDDLVAQRVALGNQLRALLEHVWPGAAAIFADVTSPIALAFLARYPSAPSAVRLGERRLAQFLAQQGYSGRRAPADLLARLHAAPTSRVADSEAEASAEVVRALVAVLTPLGTQIQQLTAAIAAALTEHPDGHVVTSFPRSGQVNAAQVLAELGDDRQRFTSADHLAAEAGVAPVTRESGKARGVGFRWACNKRLRQAFTTLADNSRHASPWAAGVYSRARQRGCDHPHAVRILARAWIRILWRCWQDRVPYDLTRHRGAVAA